MRLVVLLVVLLAACSADPPPLACTPGESRGCVCPTGGAGVQLCDEDGSRLGPCECVGADAGALDEVDAATDDAGALPRDAGVQDAGLDAGRADAGRDAGSDAGSPWACDVIAQTGCRTGYACRLSQVGGRRPGNGPPECVPRGTLVELQSCTASPDDCRAGLFCSGVCYRYCDPRGEPCPPVEGTPFRCDTTTLLEGNPVGVGHCAFAR